MAAHAARACLGGCEDRIAADAAHILLRRPELPQHLKEAADKRGEVPNVPDRPEIGYRAQNALIAHDEDVVIPATATEKIHYEANWWL